MRKIWQFLKHPLVWRLLLALLCFWAVHALGVSFKLEPTQRLVIASLFALTIFGFLVAIWLRDDRRERKLKAGIQAQTEKELETAGAESREELEKLAAEFQKAVEEIAETRPRPLLGLGGMYAMPWIMVLGPPAAGKTSAIQQSELRFTSRGRGAMGMGLAGMGGTRNCTWWIAEEAIFLDTAGRYAVREEDHAEWLGFLKLLRSYRPRRPINGAIVQVGIDVISDSDPAMLYETALQLQGRLDELIRVLEVRFPVHLVFSKCDTVDGFAPFFRHLTKEERRSPWGFRLDVDDLGQRPIVEAFDSAFSSLTDRLVEHDSRRLAQLPQAADRDAALVFARELESRRERLRAFLDVLFEASRNRERPWLRSVFFCSTMQGADISPGVRHRLTGKLELAVPPTRVSPDPGATTFVKGMFEEVIQEATLRARLSARGRRQRLGRLGMATLAALLLCFPGSCYLEEGYVDQREWAEQVKQETARIEAENGKPRGTVDELLKALEPQEKLRVLFEQEDVDVVDRPAMRALNDSIDLYWILPLRETLERHLRATQNSRPNEGSSEQEVIDGFRALRLEYVLSGRACGRWEPTDPDVAVLMGQDIGLIWSQKLEHDRKTPLSPAQQQRIAEQVRLFLRDGQRSRLMLDPNLTRGARAALEGRTAPELVITLLAEQFGLNEREQLVSSEAVSDPRIQRLYRPAGCARLKEATDEPLVWLGCVLPKMKTDVEWKPAYRLSYQKAWARWLTGLAEGIQWKEEDHPDPADMLDLAQSLASRLASDNDAALPGILKSLGGPPECPPPTAKKAPTLGARAPALLNKALRYGDELATWVANDDLCKPAMLTLCDFSTALDAKDKPLGAAYARYLLTMTTLRDRLKTLPNDNDETLKLVRETMGSTGPLYEAQYAREQLFMRLEASENWEEIDTFARGELLRGFGLLNQKLQHLEQQTWRALTRLAATAIQEHYQKGIIDVWNREMRCNRDEDEAIVCPRIDAFFKTNLEKFVEGELDNFYERNNQGGCILKAINGSSVPISDAACRAITALRDRRLQCPAGAAPPPKPLELIGFNADRFPSAVLTIELDTGKKVLEYDNITGRLRDSRKTTSGFVVLNFYGRDMTLLKSTGLSNTLEELVTSVVKSRRPGQRLGATLELHLRPDELPPGTGVVDRKVTLIFAELPSGPPPGPKPTPLNELCNHAPPFSLLVKP